MFCNLLPLLTIGAIIQFIGLIKEKQINKWIGIISIVGLLLLNNPDIELISSIGTTLLLIGYWTLGIQQLKHKTNP